MSDWIAIKDKAPLWGQLIIAFTPEEDISYGCNDEQICITDQYCSKISHWMPIPEYPKGFL